MRYQPVATPFFTPDNTNILRVGSEYTAPVFVWAQTMNGIDLVSTN
jgi:hypothetical protein